MALLHFAGEGKQMRNECRLLTYPSISVKMRFMSFLSFGWTFIFRWFSGDFRQKADGNAWKTTNYSTHTLENVQLSDKGRIALSVLGSKKLCESTKFSGHSDGNHWKITIHPKDKGDMKRTDINGCQKSTFVSHSFALSGKVWQRH